MVSPFGIAWRVEQSAACAMRKASHHDDLAHREWKHHVRFLRNEGDASGQFAGCKAGERLTGKLCCAAVLPKKARKDFEKCRLAGTVGTEKSDKRRRVDAQRNAAQDSCRRVAEGHIL